jgi:DNA-binding MarR family transcriptional regulator
MARARVIPSEQEVLTRLCQASGLALRFRKRDLAEVGISPIEAETLFALCYASEPLTSAGLSRRTHGQSGSTHGVVKALASRGLVTTTSSPRAGKRAEVQVTAKGRKAYADLVRLGGRTTIASLTRDEKRHLEILLTKLLNSSLAELASSRCRSNVPPEERRTAKRRSDPQRLPRGSAAAKGRPAKC